MHLSFPLSFPMWLYHVTSPELLDQQNSIDSVSFCNNVTLGMESSQSGGHMTTIIQKFTLVNLTSTITPHWVWLLFGASGLLLHLCTQPLFTLHTRPLTVYAIELGEHLRGMFRFGIICRSSTCRGMRLDHPRTSLSGEERLVGWTQLDLLLCTVVSRIISISQRKLTRWQKSDTSKARLDGTGPWRLFETIGPDVCIHVERFWNDWELGRVGLPWSPR